MKNIEFQNPNAAKMYEAYMMRIKKSVATLSATDQSDILMEFNSHIFEALQQRGSSDESDALIKVIQRLGSPEEVLKPMVAEKKLIQATRTFNPIHVLKALMLNISNGISYLVFSLLYLMLFVILFLCVAKLFVPDKVGLFYGPTGFKGFGLNLRNLEGTGIKEVSGGWFIPAALVTSTVLYFIITLLLKLKRKK